MSVHPEPVAYSFEYSNYYSIIVCFCVWESVYKIVCINFAFVLPETPFNTTRQSNFMTLHLVIGCSLL